MSSASSDGDVTAEGSDSEVMAESSDGRLTAELSRSIEYLISSKSGTFSCGGSIPIVVEGNSGHLSSSSLSASSQTGARAALSKGRPDMQDSNRTTTSRPVTVRWEPPAARPTESRNVCFPVSASTTKSGKAGLEALLRDCQPATFGRGGKEIMDESYRKAAKLDATAFSSDFCPYALGLVDTAAELLMPSSSIAGGSRGVKAELYKLNVYAAPSGHFKPHVDTPRSDQQFGSLVVCLPCTHVGGGLVVRHGGQSVTYDWTTAEEDPPMIHWAAFYSDCEHEVQEVTMGNRVTLTFNLYAVPERIQVEGKTESLDVTGLPLYRAVKDAIVNSDFLPQGGTLGCYCRHTYPHAASSPPDAPLFPSVLKGSDLYLYAVFSALGLKVDIRLILDDAESDEDEYGYESDDDMKDNKGDNGKPSYVRFDRRGNGALRSNWVADDDVRQRGICEKFGQSIMVNWLNKPNDCTKDVGYYYPSYGNEPSMGSKYTYAALLVTVDEPGRRNK